MYVYANMPLYMLKYEEQEVSCTQYLSTLPLTQDSTASGRRAKD